MKSRMESQVLESFLVASLKARLISDPFLTILGAALSLYTGYQLKLTLGGILALSGYLPNFAVFPKVTNVLNFPLKLISMLHQSLCRRRCCNATEIEIKW
jgi:hypothetical protein